jgi:hypothetical protein
MKGSLYHDRGSEQVETAVSFIKPRLLKNVKRRLAAIDRMADFSAYNDSTHQADCVVRVRCVLARALSSATAYTVKRTFLSTLCAAFPEADENVRPPH